jgi:hypothetical protein
VAHILPPAGKLFLEPCQQRFASLLTLEAIMKKWIFPMLAWPLMAVTPQHPQPSAPASQVMPGGYQLVESDAAEVQTAKATAQNAMSNLRIEAVLEAYKQVVAGMNYKLICQVSAPDGAATWEFVIWHQLDDSWKLTSARQL